jgi:hypothetical protein
MPQRWEPTGRTLSSWDGIVTCCEWGGAAASDARPPLFEAIPIAGCDSNLELLVTRVRLAFVPGSAGGPLREELYVGKTACQI